jgi:hypothetical protein
LITTLLNGNGYNDLLSRRRQHRKLTAKEKQLVAFENEPYDLIKKEVQNIWKNFCKNNDYILVKTKRDKTTLQPEKGAEVENIRTRTTSSSSSSSNTHVDANKSEDKTYQLRKRIKVPIDYTLNTRKLIHDQDELIYNDLFPFDAVDDDVIEECLENILPDEMKLIYPLKQAMSNKSAAIIINYDYVNMEKRLESIVKKYGFKNHEHYVTISKEFEGKALMIPKNETVESMFDKMASVSNDTDQQCISMFIALLRTKREIHTEHEECEKQINELTNLTIYFVDF